MGSKGVVEGRVGVRGGGVVEGEVGGRKGLREKTGGWKAL